MPLLDHFHPPLRKEIDVWPKWLTLGGPLPVLALNAEVCQPVDLEATCTDACQRRR
jgi:hypothetical protein